MNKHSWILALPLIFSLGCFSLEPFYFKNVSVDEYFRAEDMEEYEHYQGIIPDELIRADSFVVDSDTIYAFWALQPADTLEEPDTTLITILYNHGNYHNINHYWDRVELLWELGYRVYIYDYPGYGKSQGEPNSESCFASAEEACYIVRNYDLVDTTRLVFYGFSLGGYMSAHLAADVWSPAAVILEAVQASTAALLKDSGLLDLPSGIVSGDDFDNEKRIADIDCPLLMIHGKADDYTVFERHALVLWELAEQPKDSFWVEDAGHGDIPYAAGEAVYGKRIVEFLDTYPGEAE